MRFKMDRASLINRRKFTVFRCFTLSLRAISEYKPPLGTYFWRGDLTEGFLSYEFGGLILGGANFWNFTVSCENEFCLHKNKKSFSYQ